MVTDGFTERVTLEQSLERAEGLSHVSTTWKDLPGPGVGVGVRGRWGRWVGVEGGMSRRGRGGGPGGHGLKRQKGGGGGGEGEQHSTGWACCGDGQEASGAGMERAGRREQGCAFTLK